MKLVAVAQAPAPRPKRPPGRPAQQQKTPGGRCEFSSLDLSCRVCIPQFGGSRKENGMGTQEHNDMSLCSDVQFDRAQCLCDEYPRVSARGGLSPVGQCEHIKRIAG